MLMTYHAACRASVAFKAAARPVWCSSGKSGNQAGPAAAGSVENDPNVWSGRALESERRPEVCHVLAPSTRAGARRLTVAPHHFKFLANFRNCFDMQQKSYRARGSPLRVVVSYDHIQAVKRHYVRAGGN
jgi:hypothetical protein